MHSSQNGQNIYVKLCFFQISVNQMPTYRRALKMWKPNNSELLQAYREYITKSAQVLWQAQEEALSENVENLINFEMNLIQVIKLALVFNFNQF